MKLSLFKFYLFHKILEKYSILAIECYSCQPVMSLDNKSCQILTCPNPTDQCYYGQLQTSPGDKKSTVWWSGCHTPSRNDRQALEQQCTIDNYFSICDSNLCNDLPRTIGFLEYPPQVDANSIKYIVKNNDQIDLSWDTTNHCKKFWFTIEYRQKYKNSSSIIETVKNSRSITLKNLKKDQVYLISITTHAPNSHPSKSFNFDINLKNPTSLLSVLNSNKKVKKSLQSSICHSFSPISVDGTIRPKPDSKYCVLQHRNSKLFWGECRKQEKKQFRIVRISGDDKKVFIQSVSDDLCWTINPYATRSQLVILKPCKYDASQAFVLGRNMIWLQNNGIERFCVPFEAGKKLATKQCFPENE